jgi:tetratricopeptide (TPR) repeat protein
MSDTNVRLQNLREFTVQIRDANDQIVGTGIAVSTDGKIVTCAHVVRAAGVEPRNANDAEISVYFPQVRGGEEKSRRATIAKYFNDYDDDVVLLQLKDPSPLAPEQIPVLGTASSSEENPFRSYGYRRLDQYIAGWAHGTIQGCVEAPEGFNIQCEPVQLESSQINSGMSGSAVLDMTRNLVVGIVSETWFPDLSTKDRDTAWAVDGRVLNLEPLGLPLQDVSLPLKPAPEPKTDEETKQQVIELAQSTVAERRIGANISWNNAPAILHEWTGRKHLLMRLTEDWNDPKKRVTGLIGFGGEGKSSLVRKWVDDLLKDSSQQQPDGVFWWGFYENRSVDEFLEAALNYMSGGRVDPRQIQSSNLRAQIIGAMLGTGRYLFVLDGLEVMQHQEGDQYGLLQSTDLRDLLTFFARPEHQSFCLITSRAPVLDLMDYTTYTHRDVERLSDDDGRTLLQVLGVKGSDTELNKVVADWGGHALTLSILAAYLVDRYDGDIKHLADIPVPTADEPRYERVHRLLRRYDEHLTQEEREFLKLFSVFRLPVQESAFEKVFVPLLNKMSEQKPKGIVARIFGSKIDNADPASGISSIVKRLVTYRIIRHDEQEKAYTTHPLIRNHYFALFTKGDPSQEKTAHEQIKDYYLSIAGDTPEYPTLDDLKPLIEVVHHACKAGAYSDANQIRRERIYQDDRSVLIRQLGAYETDLALLLEFFPAGDISGEPLVDTSNGKYIILNNIGFDLIALGRLSDASQLFQRAILVATDINDWRNVSVSYNNLADLNVSLGKLDASAEAARQSLNFALRVEDKEVKRNSIKWQAWANHLLGNLQTASDDFAHAEILEQEIYSQLNIRYLYSLRGIQHADHLRRMGQLDYARRVADANLRICVNQHWPRYIGMSHRVLGDIKSDLMNYASTRAHYDSALKIARSISDRAMLIEVLMTRGRWQAKHIKDANAAFSDLNEALGYCIESGYRIYEADVRVALAWAYLANDEKENAKQSAERALQMSNEMGYYWGKVDAEEVLERIKAEG